MSDQALYDPRRSIAVSSSAGSGKTYTLTTRLLIMLLSGVELSQVLAITFTNAAANDIREELFNRVSELEAGKPSEVALFGSILSMDENRLRAMACDLRLKLIRQFSLLQISTIHSFFTRIIGCFPGETGVIDFTVIDDPDREALLEGSLVRFFDLLHRDKKLANRMYTLLTSRDERGIGAAGRFRGIYDLIHARYFMLENLTQALDDSIENIEQEFFKNRNFLLSQEYRRILESLVRIIDGYLNEHGEKKHPRSFVQSMKGFLQSGTIKILTDCAPFRDYRDGRLKNYLQRIAEGSPDGDGFVRLFHDAWRGLSNFHMSEMVYRVYTWLDVYVLIQRIYQSFKEPSHVIDFTDIELIARDFLTRLADYSFFRARLESGLGYILIDEFQDTSELQWSTLRPLIGNSIKEGGTLFYVGDVKQSIYRWRGGEPYLFDKVKEELEIREERLPYSYRQNRVLLDFVNGVFSSLSDETGGRFHYQEQDLPPHILDRERGFVHIKGLGGQEEIIAEVHGQLRTLQEAGVEPDDIAILCRKNTEVGAIERMLRDEGTTFNSAGRTRLLEDYCIRDILNAIRFVLDPHEPLFLAGLLRAPFFRYSYGSLDELTGEGKGAALQQLKTRDRPLWDRVQKVIRLSRYRSPSSFIMHLYGELDIFAVYPGKREPLMAFLELAYGFESGGESVRLKDFYRYLQANDKYITLRAGDQGGITVQTIHSAKGLEYHTVMLPFLSQRFHASLDQSLMYSRDREGRIDRFAIANRVYVDYYADQDEIDRIQRENDSNYQIDEINTLYVALTRARENLVILPLIGRGGESIGKMLLKVAGQDFDVEGETGLRIGDIVPSSVKKEERAREYVPTRPVKQMVEPEGSEWREQVETLSSVWRRGRREGLLRGIIFHAVIERIRKLPLGSGELNRLLDMASAREGGRYTEQEVTAAVKEVRPMILNVIADHRLTKYFSDKAVSELGIFSVRYQNLTGRIDRIYLGEEIEVIDFKTNPINGDAELGRLVEAYGEQVDAYCATVREIFPGRSVRGYLYFTGAADSKRLVQVGRKS